MKILYVLLTAFLLTCTKERSCEGCRGVVVDTIPKPVDTIPVVDTIYRDSITMIAHYNIYIEDNKAVRFIYPEYSSKYHPDTYHILSSIAIVMDTTVFSTYKGSINLLDHLPPNEMYNKGDTFIFRMEIRYRWTTSGFTDSTILTY